MLRDPTYVDEGNLIEAVNTLAIPPITHNFSMINKTIRD